MITVGTALRVETIARGEYEPDEVRRWHVVTIEVGGFTFECGRWTEENAKHIRLTTARELQAAGATVQVQP